jgi:hypothetical protein
MLLDGKGERSAGLHGREGASGLLALADAAGQKGPGLQLTAAGVMEERGHDELHGDAEVREDDES